MPDQSSLLKSRQLLTSQITATPYDPYLYCTRAQCYLDLGYPDLAVGDAYKAVLLADYVRSYAEEGELEIEAIVEPETTAGENKVENRVRDAEENPADEDEDEEQDGEEDPDGEEELRWARRALPHIAASAASTSSSVESALSALELRALSLIVEALAQTGCRLQAREYALLAQQRQSSSAATTDLYNFSAHAVALGSDSSPSPPGPAAGTSRRVVYPWNTHEPDRFAAETLDYINTHLVSQASSACSAAVVDLPVLSSETKDGAAIGAGEAEVLGYMKHLGVFATRDIYVSEVFLREESALTVVTDPADGGLCEYCGRRWRAEVLPSRPQLKVDHLAPSDSNPSPSPQPCPFSPSSPPAEASILDPSCVMKEEGEERQTYTCTLCDAAESSGEEELAPPVWCSTHCRDQAMRLYHPALCCRPVAWLHRAALGSASSSSVIGATKSSLPGGEVYALLLLKTFAMALTQRVHPLQLDEVKYLYGVPQPREGESDLTIPWGFEENVRGVVAVLEALGVDVFSGRSFLGPSSAAEITSAAAAAQPDPTWWDTWVVNTLLAKFRGVASGRLDSRGRTEAAAAHTVYSMLNHSCAPNVRWKSNGLMSFWGTKGFGYNPPPEVDGKERKGGEEGEYEGGKEVAVHKGQELLSCYCDPELPWQERREWMKGCLGGYCMCTRCIEEERAELTIAPTRN